MIGKQLKTFSLLLILFSFVFSIKSQDCIEYKIPKGLLNYKELKKIKKLIDKDKLEEASVLVNNISLINIYSIFIISEYYFYTKQFEICNDTLRYGLKHEILSLKEKEIALQRLVDLNYVRLGNPDTALIYLDRLYDINEKSSYFFNIILMIHEENKDYDKYDFYGNLALIKTNNNEYYLLLVNNSLKSNFVIKANKYLLKYEEKQMIRGFLYYYTKANFIMNKVDILTQEEMNEALDYLEVASRIAEGSNNNKQKALISSLLGQLREKEN